MVYLKRVRYILFSRKKYLKGFPDGRRGYLKVKLYDVDLNPVTISIHKIVAIHYVPGRFKGATVNHKDTDILNNESENLEWMSNLDNVRHAIVYKNTPFRYKQLTEEKVHEICKLLYISKLKPTAISKLLSINKTTIDKISQYKNYKRISDLYK